MAPQRPNLDSISGHEGSDDRSRNILVTCKEGQQMSRFLDWWFADEEGSRTLLASMAAGGSLVAIAVVLLANHLFL